MLNISSFFHSAKTVYLCQHLQCTLMCTHDVVINRGELSQSVSTKSITYIAQEFRRVWWFTNSDAQIRTHKGCDYVYVICLAHGVRWLYTMCNCFAQINSFIDYVRSWGKIYNMFINITTKHKSMCIGIL